MTYHTGDHRRALARDTSRECSLHGVLVKVYGTGVLITGRSGTGKSEFALGLVSKGHRLVADDVVLIRKISGALIGRPPERFEGLLAIRGLGIFDVRQIFGRSAFDPVSRIDLNIELPDHVNGERGQADTDVKSLGIPQIRLKSSGRRDQHLISSIAEMIRRRPELNCESDVLAAHDLILAASAK